MELRLIGLFFLFIELLSISTPEFVCAHSNDIYEKIQSLDTLGNSHWRANLNAVSDGTQNTYRSRFGTQVHENCFPLNISNPERQQLIEKIDGLLQTTARVVVDECARDYPELMPYLSEWISQFRRAVVVCNDAGVPRSIETFKFEDKRFLKGVAPPSDKKTYSTSHEPVIFLPQRDFSALTKFEMGAAHPLVETLIHEILHNTTANNRKEHNQEQLDRIKEDCTQDPSWDRIRIITSLCTGSPTAGNIDGEPAILLLRKKIAKCGQKQGCEDTFTDTFNSFHARTTIEKLKNKLFVSDTLTQDLPGDLATKLCQQIVTDGQCYQSVLDDKSYKNRLAGIQDEIKKRYAAIFPQRGDEIPLTLVRLFPALTSEFNAIQSKDCFKSLVELVGTDRYRLKHEFEQMNGVSAFLYSDLSALKHSSMKMALQDNLHKYKNKLSCKKDGDFERVGSFFLLLQSYVDRTGERNLQTIFGLANLKPGEKFDAIRSLVHSDIDKTLMGPDLYQRALAAAKDADTFRLFKQKCSRSGGTASQAIEFAPLLDYLLPPSSSSSCK